MDKRWLLPPVVLAVAVWYLWTHRGRTHTMTLDQRAYAPAGYTPYAHWWHQRPEAWTRNYPDRVGPLCLGTVLSAEEGAISTTQEYADAC